MLRLQTHPLARRVTVLPQGNAIPYVQALICQEPIRDSPDAEQRRVILMETSNSKFALPKMAGRPITPQFVESISFSSWNKLGPTTESSSLNRKFSSESP